MLVRLYLLGIDALAGSLLNCGKSGADSIIFDLGARFSDTCGKMHNFSIFRGATFCALLLRGFLNFELDLLREGCKQSSQSLIQVILLSALHDQTLLLRTL